MTEKSFKDYLEPQTVQEHNANVPLWKAQSTAQFVTLQNMFSETLEGA